MNTRHRFAVTLSLIARAPATAGDLTKEQGGKRHEHPLSTSMDRALPAWGRDVSPAYPASPRRRITEFLTRGRRLLAGVTAVLLVLALPGVAAAKTDVYRLHGTAAHAMWQMPGLRVDLTAGDYSFHNPPGRPQHFKDVGAMIIQVFCDEGTDERVRRLLLGGTWDDASVSVLDVPRSLEYATAAAVFTVTGEEVRFPNCQQPDISRRQSRDISLEVEVEVTWEGVGDIGRERWKNHGEFEEARIRGHGTSTSRAAVAEASVRGLEELGVPQQLGTTESASLDILKGHDAWIMGGRGPS